MAPGRPVTPGQGADSMHKKRSKGFTVGPAHLSDGSYKRKVTKIRNDLIHRASVKRSYDKVKAQQEREEKQDQPEPTEPASLEPHPARQALIQETESTRQQPNHRRPRDLRRTDPFWRETLEAQRKKAAAEEQQRVLEAANKERAKKLAQRERWRREMTKARGYGKGGTGKPKLGRESKVLLEKVQQMIAKEKEHG